MHAAQTGSVKLHAVGYAMLISSFRHGCHLLFLAFLESWSSLYIDFTHFFYTVALRPNLTALSSL